MRWYYWAGLGLAVIALAVGLFINNRMSAALVSQADIDSMRRAYQQEDQSAFRIPAPQSLPAQAPNRLQIIKGWVENGEVREAVRDVICADGRAINPQTKRCAPTTASVDLSSCAHDARRGAAELKTVWTDTDYHRDQKAFYYARVIQNPTCRWSTYDSLRLNQPPPSRVPATIREMAWSSPIWLGPQN